MYEDATWYGSIDIRADHMVLDGFPAIRERGTAPPLGARRMSIVATVAHLSYTAELYSLLPDGYPGSD